MKFISSLAITLLVPTAGLQSMQQIISAHSENVTAETPIKLTSLLCAFMQGTFEAKEDGSILYPRYNNKTIGYKDTITDVLEKLEATQTAMHFMETGMQCFPEERTPYAATKKDETIKSHIALREFYKFMIYGDSPAEEIIANRDALKKGFMAARTQQDIASVATSINALCKKPLGAPAAIIE